MAVTQYVGARYVAHGWTEWNNQTAYDGMYVVKYNLAWYIAKEPVPVGTLPTNERYWALVDNWQGNVELLRQELNSFETETNNNISVIDAQIEGLKTRTATNETKIAHNRKMWQGFIKENAKFVFISDSFGGVANNWIDQVINRMQLPQSRYLRMSTGGGGWISNGVNGKFIDVLDKITEGVTDLDTYDFVVIVGGTNDTNTSMNVEFKNAVINTTVRAHQLFPNAKILNGYVASLWRDSDFQGTPSRHAYITYGEYQCCQASNTRGYSSFIPHLSELIANINDLYDSEEDLVHPNGTGFGYIASAVIQAMCGGNGTFGGFNYTLFNQQIMSEGGWEISARSWQSGKDAYVTVNNFFYNGEPITLASGTWFQIPLNFKFPYREIQWVSNCVTLKCIKENDSVVAEPFYIRYVNRGLQMVPLMNTINVKQILAFGLPTFKVCLF